jgi:RNA-directed DNA polymerase
MPAESEGPQPESEATLTAVGSSGTPRLERRCRELHLGKRSYPIWTPAMVEAIERYRQSGRRWYLLYDKLYALENLRVAWEQVKENGGAAGVSGQTIAQYGDGLEQRLNDLARKLKDQTYEARPIRRAYIPKGNGKLRPLGIPEVEDRIVQAALVRLIEPIFESKFMEVSWGFRPERSAHNALAELDAALKAGFTQIVDADITDCFGSIPWTPLVEEVAREVSDPKVLGLVKKFLKAEVMEGMNAWQPEEGTPQGAVLSPLLANVYLHCFDEEMTRSGCRMVRYADDFVILCRSASEAEQAKEKAKQILAEMGLQLHPEKTRIVDATREKFQFLGYEFWPQGWRLPRPSSKQKLHDRVRAKTPHHPGQSLRAVIASLNYTLRGWYAYFRHCWWSIFKDVDGFVRRRLRSILRGFSKRRGTARPTDHSRYPNRTFERLGLFSLHQKHLTEVGPRGLIAFVAKA